VVAHGVTLDRNMLTEPIKALDALVELLKRTPMSKSEAIGAQACIDIIKAELDKQPPVKSE